MSLNYQKSNLIISSDYLTHINDNIILDKNYLQLNNKSKILELYAEELVNLSENLVDDEEIIFIKNIPQPSFSSFDCLKQVIFQKKEKSLCNYDRNFYGPDKTFNTLLTKRKNNLRLYDFGEKFCNINDCRFFNIKNNYNIIINDKSHITLQSVELFEDDFFNFIQTN